MTVAMPRTARGRSAAHPLRIRDAQRGEHLNRPAVGRAGRAPARGRAGSPPLVAHPDHRVQGHLRLLQDHGDLAAAQRAHLDLAGSEEVAALEEDASPADAAGGLMRRRTASAVTDLPQPVSPANPNVSRRSSWNVTLAARAPRRQRREFDLRSCTSRSRSSVTPTFPTRLSSPGRSKGPNASGKRWAGHHEVGQGVLQVRRNDRPSAPTQQMDLFQRPAASQLPLPGIQHIADAVPSRLKPMTTTRIASPAAWTPTTGPPGIAAVGDHQSHSGMEAAPPVRGSRAGRREDDRPHVQTHPHDDGRQHMARCAGHDVQLPDAQDPHGLDVVVVLHVQRLGAGSRLRGSGRWQWR